MNKNFINVLNRRRECCEAKVIRLFSLFAFGVAFVWVVCMIQATEGKVKEGDSALAILKSKILHTKAESNDLSIKQVELAANKKQLIDTTFSLKINTMVLEGDVENLKKQANDKRSTLSTLQQSLNNMNNNYKEKQTLIDEINAVASLTFKLQQTIEDISNKHKESKIASRIIQPNQATESIKLLDFNASLQVSFELIYRMTRDGFKAAVFHQKCDYKVPTLTILQLDDDSIVGGYTTRSWDGDGFKADPDAFIFNFNLKKKYAVLNQKRSIFTNLHYFVVFGSGDIYLGEDQQSSIFPQTYGGNTTDNELTNKRTNFSLKEFEVFKLSFFNQ